MLGEIDVAIAVSRPEAYCLAAIRLWALPACAATVPDAPSPIFRHLSEAGQMIGASNRGV